MIIEPCVEVPYCRRPCACRDLLTTFVWTGSGGLRDQRQAILDWGLFGRIWRHAGMIPKAQVHNLLLSKSGSGANE